MVKQLLFRGLTLILNSRNSSTKIVTKIKVTAMCCHCITVLVQQDRGQRRTHHPCSVWRESSGVRSNVSTRAGFVMVLRIAVTSLTKKTVLVRKDLTCFYEDLNVLKLD